MQRLCDLIVTVMVGGKQDTVTFRDDDGGLFWNITSGGALMIEHMGRGVLRVYSASVWLALEPRTREVPDAQG